VVSITTWEPEKQPDKARSLEGFLEHCRRAFGGVGPKAFLRRAQVGKRPRRASEPRRPAGRRKHEAILERFDESKRAGTAKRLNVTYYLYPRRHRAFIVEDEILIALDLEAEMNALGFNFCRLAPRANKACPLAMSDHPDIVLMDLYDGVREYIEAATRLREGHGTPLCS
jgi:hypothetical protein